MLHHFDGPTAIADGRTPCDPPHPPGPSRDRAACPVRRGNRSVRRDASFGILLDLAEACHVPAGCGCWADACHVRQSGLVSGAVAYQVEPLEPSSAGQLTCTVHARATAFHSTCNSQNQVTGLTSQPR